MTSMSRRVLALLVACQLGFAAAAAGQTEPPALRSSNVTWLGTIPEAKGISIAMVGTQMYVSTLGGLAVYDISAPEQPQKLGELSLPLFQNEDVSTNGQILLMSRDAGLGLSRLYVIDVRDPAHPRLLSSLDTGMPRITTPDAGRFSNLPNVYERIGHTASCLDGCRWALLAGRSNGTDLVDLRDPSRPRFAARRVLPMPDAACAHPAKPSDCLATHDVQVDSTGLAWVAGGGGTVAYDMSDPERPRLVYRTDASARTHAFQIARKREPNDGSHPNDMIHHNSLRISDDVVLVTEEDFHAGCVGAGDLQSWRIGPDHVLRALGEWRVERDPARRIYCSAHYFDARDGLVAQGWYEAGVRLIDVSDPAHMRAAGYWIPRRGDVMSAYFAPTDPAGEIVYAVDEQRGVDILRVDRSQPPQAGNPPPEQRADGLSAGRDRFILIGMGDQSLARPGATVRLLIGVVDTAGHGTPAGKARIELGAGLVHAGAARGQAAAKVVTLPLPALRRRAQARLSLTVRVARHPPPVVEAAVTATSPDDYDPADDYSVVRIATRPRALRAQATTATAAGAVGSTLAFCPLTR